MKSRSKAWIILITQSILQPGMERIIIFGNSGSGKSTLAKALAKFYGAEHLDLDTIAWEAGRPGVRADFDESRRALLQFIESYEGWVVEGCYSELLKVAAEYCTEMIFLNPGIEACVLNCRARPFEAHKYESMEAQDANLRMLIEWVREYETRDDEFSLREHRKLFDTHEGRKAEYKSNDEAVRRVNAADK
jgi:adenylate kinase family enzyme